MLKAILGAASAIALGSPAVAADLSVPPYREVPGYEGSYEYGTTPPIVEEPPPAVFVRPPFIVAPPPVVVHEYPLYAAPAYGGPAPYGRWGWGHRHYGDW